MIKGKALLTIVSLSLLLTACNNKPVEESSSKEESDTSTSSVDPEKKMELIPEVGEVRLLFEHGVAGENNYYNYCPSIFIENHREYVYYCSNQLESNVTDYIAYRELTIQNNSLHASDIDFVLEHGDVSKNDWDSRHVCDPSVIKGEFTYHGESYSYLMAFLGCISSDCTLNETGIAVAKNPKGPWVKCNFKDDGVTKINPIVPCSDFSITGNFWGTGQPSLVSVDNKGRVLLFTTIGASNGTYTNIREYDFSNLDEPVKIRERLKIMSVGVRTGRQGYDIINNADFAYDVENRRILMVKGRQPFGTDNRNPSIVADTLDVYYIDDTEGTNVGDVLFAGNNTEKQWKLIGTIDQSTTGFLRNHNACLITDAYGHFISSDRIGVALTRSDEGQSSNWSYLSTYRIYATSVALPENY